MEGSTYNGLGISSSGSFLFPLYIYLYVFKKALGSTIYILYLSKYLYAYLFVSDKEMNINSLMQK